nr:hypothetical protein [Alphaproteobacteria bacterium]
KTMDYSLQAQMLAERCQMYLRHLRGVVYLLNYQSQIIRPGVLPAEWRGLMQQIQHLAESTEREVRHYQQSMAGPANADDKAEKSKAA